MEEPIENLYFNWLCAKVLNVTVRNYYDLMHILYTTEFVWIIEGDKNRAEDGCELREDFTRETGYFDQELNESPCSVFEVLLAIANRASFQTDTPVREWFWRFMRNLGLDEYRRVQDFDRPVIEDVLNMFIYRTYRSDGHGGLFPMNDTNDDQRKKELWHQLCEYLDDQRLLP